MEKTNKLLLITVQCVLIILSLLFIAGAVYMYIDSQNGKIIADNVIVRDYAAIVEANVISPANKEYYKQTNTVIASKDIVSTDKETQREYEVVKSNVTWDEARKYCESRGAQLASITSREAYEEIIALADEKDLTVVFLGGFYNVQKGDFEWLNGDSFNFTDWAPGEPNNEDDTEFYLAMYNVDGSWGWYDVPNDANTYYSSNIVGFVCEYD